MQINYVKRKENTVVPITPIVSNMQYSGSNNQASRRLTTTIIDNGQDVRCGDMLQVIDNGLNYVGEIMNCRKNSSQKTYSIECNDELIHLANSYTTKILSGNAKTIAAQLCVECGVGYQYIEDTGLNVTKKSYEGVTYYDILRDIYGDAYRIYMIGALMAIIEKGWTTDYILNSKNIINVSKSDDISDIKNKVVTYSDRGEVKQDISNDTIWQYGIFQAIGKNDTEKNSPVDNRVYQWWTDKTSKQVIETPTKTAKKSLIVNELMEDITNELVVEAIGDNTCVSGNYIRFRDKDTGILGLYEIVNDSHSYVGKKHTMTLTLDFIGIIKE